MARSPGGRPGPEASRTRHSRWPRFAVASGIIVLAGVVIVAALRTVGPPQGGRGLADSLLALRQPDGLYGNFSKKQPDLANSFYARLVWTTLDEAAMPKVDGSVVRVLLAAQSPDTFLTDTMYATQLDPGLLKTSGFRDRILALRSPTGYFEDVVGSQLSGTDLLATQVQGTYAAVTMLKAMGPEGLPPAAAADASRWLVATSPSVAASPFLTWRTQQILELLGGSLDRLSLTAYIRTRLDAFRPPSTMGLTELFDLYGLTALAGDVGVQLSSDEAQLIRTSVSAAMTQADDPIASYSALQAYLAARGDPGDTAPRRLLQDLGGLTLATGLQPLTIVTQPSYQATWFALGALALAGQAGSDESARRTLEAGLDDLARRDAQEQYAWLQAYATVGGHLDEATRSKLGDAVLQALPTAVDESSVVAWYYGVLASDLLASPGSDATVAAWAISSRQDRLLATYLSEAQVRLGHADGSTEAGLAADVRHRLVDDSPLSVNEIYHSVRLLDALHLVPTADEASAIRRRLDAARIAGTALFQADAGVPGPDLQATYLAMLLLDRFHA